MKCFSLGLACLVLAAVRAEDEAPGKNRFSATENKDEDELGQRSWMEDNGHFRLSPVLSKKAKTLNGQNERHDASDRQERAREENTFKNYPGYEALQNVLREGLDAKPIVDTAEESEKVAADSHPKLHALGGLVVKGSETVSKALNTVMDTRRKAIMKISEGALQALNQFGAYLIGL